MSVNINPNPTIGSSHALERTQQPNTSPSRSMHKTATMTRRATKNESKEVTQAELANCRRLFMTFDVDNSGYLEFSELKYLLRCLGLNLDDEVIDILREEFDDDNSGTLDFEEFVQLMQKSSHVHDLKAQAQEFEREHIKPKRSYRFMGSSSWTWAWSTLILFITLYYAIRTMYEWYRFTPLREPEWIFELVCNFIFVIDIIYHANSAVVDKAGKVHLGGEVVLKTYMKKWFAFDFLGTFPFDLIIIVVTGNESSALVKVARSVRLFRLVRVKCTLFPMRSLTTLMSAGYVDFVYNIVPILKGLFAFAVFVHFLCVVWLLLQEDDSYPYYDALYLVLYSLSTVGYGDIVIHTMQSKLFCSALFLIAMLMNGIVVSQVSMFLQKTNIVSERQAKMRETLAVLKYFHIPLDEQEEILSFQHHVLEHNMGSSHDSIISSLPQSIQESLALFMRIEYISMVPMFSVASHDCKVALAQCLSNQVFRPQEFIIIAGEKGREMYFLGHGVADVILPEGKYVATLQKGDFFGEIALVVDARRTASIKALTYCDVFRLEKRDFSSILRKFPAFRASVTEEMRERVEQFKKTSQNFKILPGRDSRRRSTVSKPPSNDKPLQATRDDVSSEHGAPISRKSDSPALGVSNKSDSTGHRPSLEDDLRRPSALNVVQAFSPHHGPGVHLPANPGDPFNTTLAEGSPIGHSTRNSRHPSNDRSQKYQIPEDPQASPVQERSLLGFEPMAIGETSRSPRSGSRTPRSEISDQEVNGALFALASAMEFPEGGLPLEHLVREDSNERSRKERKKAYQRNLQGVGSPCESEAGETPRSSHRDVKQPLRSAPTGASGEEHVQITQRLDNLERFMGHLLGVLNGIQSAVSSVGHPGAVPSAALSFHVASPAQQLPGMVDDRESVASHRTQVTVPPAIPLPPKLSSSALKNLEKYAPPSKGMET